MTWKLELLWMRKFPCLVFVLKQSYICYYMICMTVPLNTFFFYCRLNPKNKVALNIRVLVSWHHNSLETRELFWHWFYSRKCIFKQSGSLIFQTLVTESGGPLSQILKLTGWDVCTIPTLLISGNNLFFFPVQLFLSNIHFFECLQQSCRNWHLLSHVTPFQLFPSSFEGIFPSLHIAHKFT